MPRPGMDRHPKRPGDERRSRRRRGGTAEDLRHSVMRVKAAMRNSPTQILRADETSSLAVVERRSLADMGYPETGPEPEGNRFLHLPFAAARRALAALRGLW